VLSTAAGLSGVQITEILLSITLSVISFTDYPLSSTQPNKHNASEAGNNNNASDALGSRAVPDTG
jgi:hypothetical protein